MPVSNSSDASSIKALHSLRKQYPQNIIISYLNINSIQNKLNELEILISDSVDIVCIAEFKLDGWFLNIEMALDGFKKPYWLDVNASSGGLLIYVTASLPSKIINHYDFQKDIQCIAMAWNVGNKKYVTFSVYRPPRQNIKYFLNSLQRGLISTRNMKIFAYLLILMQHLRTHVWHYLKNMFYIFI